MFEVGVEPALDGTRADAQVAGDVLVGSVPMGQSDDLDSVPELAVGGPTEPKCPLGVETNPVLTRRGYLWSRAREFR